MKVVKTILYIEGLAFVVVMVALWVDEIFDLPHHFFRTPEMSFNIYEALFETLFLVMLASVVIFITWRQMKRIEQLESLLPICSFCKKIRRPDSDPMKQESWEQMELYINERTGSQFSHGLCPECAEKHYGKYLKKD